ncbi:subtilisin-like serine peptidase [Trypanosoma grayi]|uniref:subtilisin-like serine peptidase n=1 Tax=Trypanosoma grayi TaxID=71804 RepID=UPI0004F410BC|nr:subtilisin-like serine peptidase [Trypanosoma grayi]KEG11188.1 subtilisin-like serine peptidase [Trypanosoma grayi]
MFSAAGILAITRGPLPFFLVPSVVWVMSFTMHATLSYFDTFVASGSMPTSGRRNNLSLDQRVSFTLRHATRGVWVANIIAISLFAVGTRSGYMVVRQNSFLLLVAVIINVYLITLVTPAVLVLHHLILSNRRRDMQKQIDIINNHAKVMPRQEALFPVLRELKIQDEPASIEAGDGESASEGEGVSRGSLRKRLQRQFQAAAATAVWDTRQGIAGAMHKARKRKEEMVRRRQDLDEAEDGLPAFCIDDFIEVGLANPLGGVEASMPERSTRCLYFNPRMVRQSDVIHIPFPMTQRSVTSWTAMSNAISDQPATEPPTAPPEVQRIAEELGGECNSIETWAMSWRHVGDVLGVEGAADNQLLPLAVRALVKSQSLSWVVGSGNSSSNGVGGGGGGAPSRISTDVVVETNIDAVEEEELTGWGIRKLKYRWRHRHEHGRQGCWGLLGTRMDETPEQRDARIMKRKMKRVDFDVVESCSYSFFAPALYKVRWLLVVFLLALFITSCVIGLRVVPGPQLFTILDDDGRADVFHALDGVFGQQGTCEFCGPYYASADRFHLASDRDLSICRAQGYTDQINMLVDRCDVCNGTNECVDCAGNVNGTHEESMCGGCVDRESSVDACSCQLQHDCPYCEWALNISDMGGTNCSVKCTKDTCGSHGHCDGYTAKCVCEEQFTGETCGECREGFLPHNVNPNCTLECDADHDSSECVCNISVGRCTRCPPGMIGVYCNVTKVECDHGMFDTVSMKCVCFPGYAGERCELATNCSLRGRWLTAAESPLPSGDGCGCIGHWRGPSCQLCDCLNGGMCDPTTGACLCQGGFEGERCQACAAGCVAKGDCPEPSLEYWNIRTCISEHCTEVDREEEVACSACEIQKGPSTSYCKAYGQQECNADTECWWDKTTATCDWARAYDVPAVDAALSCSCNQPTVWGGSTCDTCLGPAGSTCTVEGTITGCNGLSYTDPALVVVTDACGVCGGDGFCRGCDGIPNSGLVADDCGLCGGHNNCNDTSAPPINVTYFLGLTNMGEMFGDPSWCKAVLRLCAALSMMRPFPVSCFLADYLQSVGLNYVPSVQSVFDFAAANRRFREVGFSMQHGTPLSWNYMLLNSHSETRIDAAAGDINTNYKDEREILENISGILHETRINVWVSSPSWPPAIAEVESEHTLLLVILIGCLFTLAAVHIYFISIVVAIGLTLGAMTVLFGALVACVVMSWKLDAVLELCVIPVVPIAVEYLVNLASGYFDFLRINTSHLFARDVTRKVAFQGALKFALPSIFTSCIACIGVALTLNVSVVLSCIRTGQIAITAHLLVLLVVVLFSGVLCALGPLRDIGHWTLSLAVGIFWGALLGLGLMLFSSSMK